jgi:hypothetical protein
MALVGRPLVKARSLRLVLRHALALKVADADDVLCVGAAIVGRLLERPRS